MPPRDEVDDPDEKPLFWPVFRAERLAMERGDIPFFTARASSDALILSPGRGDRRVHPGAELRSRLAGAGGTGRGRSRATGGVYRGVALRPPGPRDTAPRPVPEETKRTSGRTAGGRGLRRPGARPGGSDPVARYPHRGRQRGVDRAPVPGPGGALPAAAHGLQPIRRHEWCRAVSSGRRAIRPRVRLRRAGAGRPPPAAKHAGPPSGSSRRDDGYRRSLGPRLGGVLPAPCKPSLDEPALLEDARTGHRSHHRRSHCLRPGPGRHRRGLLARS